MLSYFRRIWKETPRALRLEFLITIFVIELLAVVTISVLTNSDTGTSRGAEMGVMERPE